LSRILHRLESIQDVYEVRRDATGSGAVARPAD
jgi:hypothetical protein